VPHGAEVSFIAGGQAFVGLITAGNEVDRVLTWVDGEGHGDLLVETLFETTRRPRVACGSPLTSRRTAAAIRRSTCGCRKWPSPRRNPREADHESGCWCSERSCSLAEWARPSCRRSRRRRRRGRGGGGFNFPPVSAAEKVADNLYMVPGQGGNTAVWVMANGVLLVDTKLANNGQAILDEVKKVTDKPSPTSSTRTPTATTPAATSSSRRRWKS
jgi:hypothetical protein